MSQSHALGWQAASGQPADVMAAMLNYDVIAKILRLRHSMRIYLKNNPTKFHPDPIWNNGAFAPKQEQDE